MTVKESLFTAGVDRAKQFCALNQIPMPEIQRLGPNDRLYHLATCAYYRPTVIRIMVEKCANLGFGGRAWSWPGYAIDRTPYGVIQHELGHHFDHTKSEPAKSRDDVQSLFSWKIYQESREPALTGYLGTDKRVPTFYAEWFAENFRLFVTNYDLSRNLRPKFARAMVKAGVAPLLSLSWDKELRFHRAPDRIIEQARKKITEVAPAEMVLI